MANVDHLKLLDQSVWNWNRWKRENPSVKVDFSGVNLRYADLRNFDLSGVKLYGADLRGVKLYGADLRDADLSEVKLYGADLRETDLSGAALCKTELNECDLRRATLRGTNLSEASMNGVKFNGARLSGATLCRVDLRGIDLRRYDLSNVDLSRANLSGANLRGASLSGAKLDDASLSGANLRGARLSGATLRGVDLSGYNLNGVDLNGVDLRGVNLCESNLSRANLRGYDLSGVDLHNSNLSRANLFGANLSRANLVGANLSGANLVGTNLSKVNLSRVNLSGVDLSGVDLSGYNLSGADLSGADLSRAQMLGTTFERVVFTAACLEDWNINSATKFDDAVCEYVYLKAEQQERRPRIGKFKPGEFATLFQQAVDTVDLIFKDGIDWPIFFQSFQDLRSRYPDQNFAIQAIEKKRDNAFVVRIEVSQKTDKVSVERLFKRIYEAELALIEQRYRTELQAKDQEISFYKQSSASMEEIAKALARKPITIETNAVVDTSTGKKDLRRSQFAGGFAETVQGDQIGGTIDNYGSSAEDITRLLTALREQAQVFPSYQRDEANDVLDDLERDLKEDQPDQGRIGRRLKKLAALGNTIGTIASRATPGDFSNFTKNVIELTKTLGLPNLHQ